MKAGELGKTITDLRQRISTLESDNARLTQEVADAQKAREEKVREVSSTYEQLVAKMKGEIDKGQVTISELKGKLTVNMVEAILFDSGKAEVKPEGLVVLGKVIEILKTVNDKSIRIEGHTDNKPIVGTLTQRYPTNWELSAGRAINVARYLQKQGIESGSLSAAAFGEFKPVATAVPGIQVCEHLPHVAKVMDKVQLVRSVTHRDNNHPSAVYWMVTGREYPRASGLSENLSREDHPHIGSSLTSHSPSTVGRG